MVRGEVAALPLKGVIDLAAERARLAKEMQKADADIARVDAKLGNAKFVASAPEEVVEEEKEKREEAVARKAKIAEALERLKDASVNRPDQLAERRLASLDVPEWTAQERLCETACSKTSTPQSEAPRQLHRLGDADARADDDLRLRSRARAIRTARGRAPGRCACA